MGRQAWHMYPSCSVHWLMQAEMLHFYHVFLLSQLPSLFLFSSCLFSSYLMSTGITVDKNGLIYFVDGTTIRKVDQNGIISTFLGSNDLTSARPLTCDNSMDINQVTYMHASAPQLLTLRVCSHRECHRDTLCSYPSSPLSLAHTWLIIVMQSYINAYILHM